jgi:hypothetical protein
MLLDHTIVAKWRVVQRQTVVTVQQVTQNFRQISTGDGRGEASL